jgi:endonuclease/exonuclease/phosphatase family metal-dependent hydrolase
MNRTLIRADLQLETGLQFRLVTAHFESLAPNDQIRTEQLDYAFGLLQDVEHAVLAGDCNFDESATSQPCTRSGHGAGYATSSPSSSSSEVLELGSIPDDFLDIGRYLRNEENQKYTMAPTSEFQAWRPDRIFVRGQGFEPESLSLVGTECIEYPIRTINVIRKNSYPMTPSDHCGVHVVFRVST